MKIHNLYTDENGESHFRDIEIEWVENAPRQQAVEAVSGDRRDLSRDRGRA